METFADRHIASNPNVCVLRARPFSLHSPAEDGLEKLLEMETQLSEVELSKETEEKQTKKP